MPQADRWLLIVCQQGNRDIFSWKCWCIPLCRYLMIGSNVTVLYRWKKTYCENIIIKYWKYRLRNVRFLFTWELCTAVHTSTALIPLWKRFSKFRWFNVNTLRPRQNGHHFADNIFKCISLNEKKILNFKQNFTEICSLGSNWQFYGSILVQIMACRRIGDKPSESMLVCCTDAFICITQPI